MNAILRILTHNRLRELNDLAHATRQQATILKRRVDNLNTTRPFPITLAMGHTEFITRVEVMLDDKGNTALLDIPTVAYNALPTMEASDGKRADIDSLFED
jgi:hypothetical protein